MWPQGREEALDPSQSCRLCTDFINGTLGVGIGIEGGECRIANVNVKNDMPQPAFARASSRPTKSPKNMSCFELPTASDLVFSISLSLYL